MTWWEGPLRPAKCQIETASTGLRTMVGRWAGSGVRDIAKTPDAIAPNRPSEVAQAAFVAKRVVDKVWAGLRVGATVAWRAVRRPYRPNQAT